MSVPLQCSHCEGCWNGGECCLPNVLVNLTPHAVTLRDAGGWDTVVPSDGVARVTSRPGAFVRFACVEVYGPDTFGDVVGLPEPVDGVTYMVSALVGAAVRRPDVVTLGTGPQDGAIRDAAGHIVAVMRLKATA